MKKNNTDNGPTISKTQSGIKRVSSELFFFTIITVI